MSTIQIPLSVSDLVDFITKLYQMLQNIQFTFGLAHFSMFDLIVFGATVSGIGTMLYIFISGGGRD